MPELPEVETVRRSLIPSVVGRRIVGLRLTDFPGVLGDTDPLFVTALLSNRTIRDVRRRAKYLIFDLDDQTSLVIHLRMTGTLTIADRAAQPLRFERLAIHFDNGRDLRFADQRKFGRVLHMTAQQWADIHSRIGPEPLDPRFTPAELGERLRQRRSPLKSALLNQHLIAGLGNIYVDEVLFHARFHPLHPSGNLTDEEIRRLHRAIQIILKDAIVNRGTTFSSYRDGDGLEGSNQRFLRVYGREGEACVSCGTPIERHVISGRSSHVCPTCQPLT